MGRMSIGGALWIVAVFAFGFAAVRSGTDTWFGLTFTMALGLLCVAALGVIHGRERRAWWLGFAVLGWAYFLVGIAVSPYDAPRALSKQLANAAYDASIVTIPTANPAYTEYVHKRNNSQAIGHLLFVLLFARFGATASRLMAEGWPRRREPAGASPAGDH